VGQGVLPRCPSEVEAPNLLVDLVNLVRSAVDGRCFKLRARPYPRWGAIGSLAMHAGGIPGPICTPEIDRDCEEILGAVKTQDGATSPGR
jgi:hypothetical protein